MGYLYGNVTVVTGAGRNDSIGRALERFPTKLKQRCCLWAESGR